MFSFSHRSRMTRTYFSFFPRGQVIQVLFFLCDSIPKASYLQGLSSSFFLRFSQRQGISKSCHRFVLFRVFFCSKSDTLPELKSKRDLQICKFVTHQNSDFFCEVIVSNLFSFFFPTYDFWIQGFFFWFCTKSEDNINPGMRQFKICSKYRFFPGGRVLFHVSLCQVGGHHIIFRTFSWIIFAFFIHKVGRLTRTRLFFF